MPPHAPCRLQRNAGKSAVEGVMLCLHTLRADCNEHAGMMRVSGWNFASTRSVQIATSYTAEGVIDSSLCLHTLRADCNGRNAQNCNMHFSERVLSW